MGGKREGRRKRERGDTGQKIDMSSARPPFSLRGHPVGRARFRGTAVAGAREGTRSTACARPGWRAKSQGSVSLIAWAEASWGTEQLPTLGSGIGVCRSFFLRV